MGASMSLDSFHGSSTSPLYLDSHLQELSAYLFPLGNASFLSSKQYSRSRFLKTVACRLLENNATRHTSSQPILEALRRALYQVQGAIPIRSDFYGLDQKQELDQELEMSSSHPVSVLLEDSIRETLPRIVHDPGNYLSSSATAALSDSCPVLVKIFIKPPSSSLSFQTIQSALVKEREILDSLTERVNVCPWLECVETERAVFLVRACPLAGHLYDRMSTRPFLTLIEKQWITFQLLMTLKEIHSQNVIHGDLKCENIFLTSFNAVLLTDFSAHIKPRVVAEDNPRDFLLFFDTSQRRSCYLAPERFVKQMETKANAMMSNELTEKMDIFSLGCVIAEMCLDGTPLFTLSQLLQYRQGTFSPVQELNRIEDRGLRTLVEHMIQRQPEDRWTAQDYLKEWKGVAFPDHFQGFLYPYVTCLLSTPGPELALLQKTMPTLQQEQGQILQQILSRDAFIERMYTDFDKLAYFCKLPTLEETNSSTSDTFLNWCHEQIKIPHFKLAPFTEQHIYVVESSATLLATFIAVHLQHLYRVESRCLALDMFIALTLYSDDRLKLDRWIPYVSLLFEDPHPRVRQRALTSALHLCATLKTLPQGYEQYMTEYFIPLLKKFTYGTEKSVLVRMVLARGLVTLAETGQLLVSLTAVSHTNRAANTSGNVTYDSLLESLRESMSPLLSLLWSDPSSYVKWALIQQGMRLCVFFGRQRARDVLISHWVTLLADRNTHLRSAFVDCMTLLGTFLGAVDMQQVLLPLLLQALTDAEERVTARVIVAVTALTELQLLSPFQRLEWLNHLIPLLQHPNTWIRKAVCSYIVTLCRLMRLPDILRTIMPPCMPFVQKNLFLTQDITLESFYTRLIPPLSRAIYQQAFIWATRSPSTFLDSRSEDQEEWKRLRQSGLQQADQQQRLKLMKLFLVRVARARMQMEGNNSSASSNALEAFVALKQVLKREWRLEDNSVTIDPEGDWSKVKETANQSENNKDPFAFLSRTAADAAKAAQEMKWDQRKVLMDQWKQSLLNYSTFQPKGQLVNQFMHPGPITCLSLTSDHVSLVVAVKQFLYFYDTTRWTQNMAHRARLSFNVKSNISQVVFLYRELTLLVATEDALLWMMQLDRIEQSNHVFYYRGCRTIRRIALNSMILFMQEWSRAGLLVYVKQDQQLVCQNIWTDQLIWQVQLPMERVTCLLCDRDARWIAVGSRQGSVWIYDGRFACCLMTLQCTVSVTALAVCPLWDDTEEVGLAVQCGSIISFWDLRDQQKKTEFHCQEQLSDVHPTEKLASSQASLFMVPFDAWIEKGTLNALPSNDTVQPPLIPAVTSPLARIWMMNSTSELGRLWIWRLDQRESIALKSECLGSQGSVQYDEELSIFQWKENQVLEQSELSRVGVEAFTQILFCLHPKPLIVTALRNGTLAIWQ